MKEDNNKIIIAGIAGGEAFLAIQRLKIPKDIIVVEDFTKEIEIKPIPVIPLAEISAIKPIEERGVIPPSYKKKHHKK